MNTLYINVGLYPEISGMSKFVRACFVYTAKMILIRSLMRDYDRQTNQPSNQNKQTDMRVHKEITFLMIIKVASTCRKHNRNAARKQSRD